MTSWHSQLVGSIYIEMAYKIKQKYTRKRTQSEDPLALPLPLGTEWTSSDSAQSPTSLRVKEKSSRRNSGVKNRVWISELR